MILYGIPVILLLGCCLLAAWEIRRRHMNRWLISYLLQIRKRCWPRPGQPVHVLLCIADHYEPKWGKPTTEAAAARVQSWVKHYPQLFGRFRDSDGRPPRHTFFFPLEEYEAAHLDGLGDLCAQGFGEVEVHLHHDGATAEDLRAQLLAFKELLAERHGQLARRRGTGELAYAFIHGNWALDNARPDGRWCGVNNELDVLRETGCYADFTLPSAPSPTQTRKINSIYYAVDDPIRPKSHDWGSDVGTGVPPAKALLLIQGPLLLDWSHRKWGLLPRVENSCLQGNQPATMERLPLWLKACVQVPTRPDWYFVKLYSHGAPEANQKAVLDQPMVRFHEGLARRAAEDQHFHYHYVTAREMYNLVRAAEASWKGSVRDALDFELVWNGAASSSLKATAAASAS
jgi:hypothetical protein